MWEVAIKVVVEFNGPVVAGVKCTFVAKHVKMFGEFTIAVGVK